jgi:predicted dehydrogenase
MKKTKAKVFGAGSIGNHLAQASRQVGWEVVVVDPDPNALKRMRDEIYPRRYGAWDNGIELYLPKDAPVGGFDVIFIGTPPDVRLKVAREALKEKPRVLQLEKPLAPPTILAHLPEFIAEVRESGVITCVGYQHVVNKNTLLAERILSSGKLGKPETLDAEFRVHWGDLLAAHPWISGLEDTYLGHWGRGGGASGEHSHATNLWQHFSHVLGQGKVVEVCATLHYVRDESVNYDKLCLLHLVTETGFTGRVVQDVVTKPYRQAVRFQGRDGFLEWYARYNKDGDMVRWQEGAGAIQEEFIPQKRPDDFYQEILHIKALLEGEVNPSESPMSLERGLDTLLVISAAHLSHQRQKAVRLRYDKEYSPLSLELTS